MAEVDNKSEERTPRFRLDNLGRKFGKSAAVSTVFVFLFAIRDYTVHICFTRQFVGQHIACNRNRWSVGRYVDLVVWIQHLVRLETPRTVLRSGN